MGEAGRLRNKEKPPTLSRPGLTVKQEQLVDLLFGPANLNRTKALRMAGYSQPGRSLHVFKTPAIKREIERRYQENRERFDVSYERCVGELAKIAFGNMIDVMQVNDSGELEFDFKGADASTFAMLGEVTVENTNDKEGNKVQKVKVKPWNKLTALDQIMRHAGLSKDRATEAVVDLADRLNQGLRQAGLDAKVIDGQSEEV